MTLKKIAEMAGVSISTASRVINKNDTKCASQEVRDKIWDAVSQTGYIPNKNAQDLRASTEASIETKHSDTRNIACVFGRSTDINNDPFFNSLYRAVEKEAFKLGYFIKFSLSFNQLFHPSSADLLKQNQIDGVVILGRATSESLNYICSRFKNVVYVGLNSVNAPIDQVLCNGYLVAKKAVSHLYDLGHREIGFIGERNEEARYRGYFDAMNEHSLKMNEDFLIDTQHSMEGGYNAIEKLLAKDRYPSAIFCCNDITAIGAIKAINKYGLDVPEDISVISIDNIEMASYIEPMLTTIDIPKEEMGKMAARTLYNRINREHKLPIKIDFPFSVKQRGTCQKL